MTVPPVLISPLLSAVPGIRHAFFTRQGGVSAGVYDSLNVGRGSRDDPADVLQNRRRAAGVFGRDTAALNTCYQIHSAAVVIAQTGFGADSPQADGVATRTPGLICGALAADCAPILLADGEAGIVAAVHAGWRGALGGVIAAAVEAMAGLGAAPARTVAVVGPCIGPHSYEVGAEFAARFKAVSDDHDRFFTPAAAADKYWFDLPAFVFARLHSAGIANCEWIGRDTYAEPTVFFSNRRAFHDGDDDYGRLLSAIMLEV